jgi:phosphoribosylformylglycinamidine synthase I
MAAPQVLILRAPGTNCDGETAFAFEQAGALPTSFHINQLLESPARTKEFQILCIPGGFSYGDDIAAGRILANQIRHHLRDALHQFKEDGKLILGICNGFQVLIKAGVLLADGADGEPATLTWNKTGRFQDRWVHLAANGDRCVFLRGIERMYLSIAHAEGRFVPRDDATLHQLEQNSQLALRYAVEPNGKPSAAQVSPSECNGAELPFPANPNGSTANVAGLCDETGRVFGLMPHPERHIERTQHPRWTRGEGRDPGDGLAVFRNAVRYFAN